MRFRTLVAAGLGAGLVAASALADDGYRHGRVRFVEPGVSLQRATEVSAEEAIVNLPFLPGDRVWTDSAGRTEFQFPDGTVVRLDRRSKLDYAGHEEGEEERIVLRLWSGSMLVRVRTTTFAHFEVETPAGTVRALDRGIVRVDVEAGETRVSVHAGEAVLDDGRQQVRLAAGERTYARWGAAAEEPRRFDPDEDDDFALWDGVRESEDRGAGRSSEYLPDELEPYAGEFETNGRWQNDGTVGNVWVPRVEVGWQPYSNGHWAWTPYGWTWVPYERWGWAAFHYGRWGFSDSWGWYWMPGRSWGPGWVSWALGGGYVGWCPLGWRDRPVTPWGHYGRYGGGPGFHGRHDPWTVVRQGDLGGRGLFRRRIAAERFDPGVLRAGVAVGLRPTRDARSLREDGAGPRAISRRMSPGDFVRELGVDNKTTIPAPWTRGYGQPPAGVDGARTGAQPRTDRGAEDRRSRGWTTSPTPGTAPAPPRSDRGAEDRRSRGWTTSPTPGTAPAPPSGGASGSSREPEDRGASRRAARPAPWYTPLQRDGTAGGERSGGGGESSGSRPRSSGGGENSGTYRPRSSGGGESSGTYRPRSSGGGGESSGTYRPRSSGGGESSGSRPRSGGGESSGGARARSSGGSTAGSSSGGHAASRPRNRN